jgi:hypothetical protein
VIPARQPLADRFQGAVVQVDDQYLLMPTPVPVQAVVHGGELIIRYGIRYLGKPHLAIVPGLVALDYGDMLTGEEAWLFLRHRSNLYPRADVIGYRNDGVDDMIVVKFLDMAEPVLVLAYTDAVATQPIAAVQALISGDTQQVPARLLEYLPHFATLENWQAANRD